ncbi:MAG TPA: hypothetical protein VFC67_22935 [Prolixibacteraceae bacterium]|nr:hypothetical protein [Prolixibacteraceae bacterium]
MNGREIDFHFLSVLTSFPKRLIKALSPYQLGKLSDQFDFIGNGSKSHNAFFSARLKGTKLYSPKPKLAGMNFGQFIFADAYYNTWLANKDDETLNKFIASLYIFDDEEFKEAAIFSKKLRIEKLPKDLRLSIAFNYSLVVSWLQNAYPLIFHSPAHLPDSAVRADDIRSKDSGWLKIFESLIVEDLIHRNEYAELPVNVVLNYLTAKYKENARVHSSV